MSEKTIKSTIEEINEGIICALIKEIVFNIEFLRLERKFLYCDKEGNFTRITNLEIKKIIHNMKKEDKKNAYEMATRI